MMMMMMKHFHSISVERFSTKTTAVTGLALILHHQIAQWKYALCTSNSANVLDEELATAQDC